MFTLIAFGNVAKQPVVELIGTNGTAKCEFTLLSDRYYRGESITEAATFVAFGEDAERFAEYVVKGQHVEVTGYQETSRWKDAQGQEHVRVRYHMTHFVPGRKPKSEYAGRNSEQESQPPRAPYRPAQSSGRSGFVQQSPSAAASAPRQEPPRQARPQQPEPEPSFGDQTNGAIDPQTGFYGD